MEKPWVIKRPSGETCYDTFEKVLRVFSTYKRLNEPVESFYILQGGSRIDMTDIFTLMIYK